MDTCATIEAFGKNEQVKNVFWTPFVAMARLVLAQVVNLVTAQQICSDNYNVGCIIRMKKRKGNLILPILFHSDAVSLYLKLGLADAGR
jgi:hypothetical protein